MIRRAENRLRAKRNPQIKVFCIGFNKCASSAINNLLQTSGIAAVHWEANRTNIALEVERRLGNHEALRTYLDQWTAYSDMTFVSDTKVVEANRYFRIFHCLYPNAYFIFNDRDPDDWVNSRMRHAGGSFARRASAALGIPIKRLPEFWKAERDAHLAAVTEYFSGHPNYLYFHVDRDDPRTLVRHLAPHFRISPNDWKRVNVTGAVGRRRRVHNATARLLGRPPPLPEPPDFPSNE